MKLTTPPHPFILGSSRKRRRFRWLRFFLILTSAMLVGVIAAAACTFVLQWGTVGSDDGQFITPRGIAVDPSGNVYVADASGDNRGQIQKFDANGNFIARLGQNNGTAQGFLNAYRITTDSSGNVYATDGAVESASNVVKKFNSSGVFQFGFGANVSAGGQFQMAAGIAVDSSGNIYVADSLASVVRKFSSTGTSIGTIGSAGSSDGQFSGPVGIAIDSANNLYVADSGNNRIQKFNSSGTFVTTWGTMGSGNGEFNAPQGVAVDTVGTVYVADTGNNRVQLFSNTGTLIEACGSGGSGDGQFAGAVDVASNTAATFFYVVDRDNFRVQKFSTAAAPTANAGADQTVECAGATTSVTLDGTASTGSGTLTYTWKEGATTLGTGSTLTVTLPLGVHTVTLTVSSSGGGSASDDVIITIADTTAPAISLNGANPITVECHTSFSDPGATASDGCAGDLTSAINVTGSVNANAVGTYTLTYTVSDGSHTTSATRTVKVVDTAAPVITLNGSNPMTVECHTSFTDPGATANDSCAGSFAAAASGTVDVNTPGTYTITYTASDPSGNPAAPQARTVNVVDTTAPVITLNGSTPVVWPPNHKYQTFSVADFVTDATDSCNTSLGIANVVISSVTSDELENGTADGNTLHDIVIANDCKQVQLRAERDGNGDGRVYTITFKVTDSSGNVGTATAKVLVPLSQASGPPIDSGVHYTVNGSCP